MNKSPNPGYTLVEVVVALLVFTVGALALAASGAIIARTMEANARRERAGRIAASRVELIKSECGSAASGIELLQGIESRWTVGQGVEVASIFESTNYSSASGLHIDNYHALAWCAP